MKVLEPSRHPGVAMLLAIAGVLVCTGCQLGPGRLKVAASHYSDAVRIANGESLLANIVRLRYRDEATFLAVTNISTQFEFESVAEVSGSAVTNGGPGTVGAGGAIRYSERPTISFSILGGETFQRRLLQPVSVGAIALLAESGWRGDRVLRLTAEHLNGLPNAPTASGPTPDGEPKYRAFMEATRLLHELRLAGVLDFEYETRREPLSASLPGAVVDGESSVLAVAAGAEFERTDDGSLQLFRDKRTLVMRFRADAAHHPDAVRFRELLRLDPQRRRFDVVELEESDYDPFDPDRYMQELAIDSRSLMGVLYYLSHGVEVHPEDLQNGTVTKTVDAAGNPFDWTTLLGGLFEVRMHEGRSRPQDAALAIRHRDRWFYLADGDQSSRTTFLLVASLFTLQAGDVEEMKPVLTLPVSR